MIQNLAEFEKQLAQGRGGAALFIEQNLPLPNEYRDALLHACLHDLRYDHQSEDGRGLYLFDLIGKTGEVEFYRSRILEVLPEHEIREDKTDYDLLQGMELARIFAQTGDAPAHEVLYTTFEKNATRGDLIGGDELVHLDGVDGLLFLVDRYDDEENGFDLSDFDLRLMNVEERDGEESAQQELKSKCAGLPIREAWLARLNVYRKERKQSRKNQPKRPRQTYEDFRQTIASRGRKMRNGRGWVKRATEAEIAQAANDLLRESDPEWLIPLLIVFDEVPFPLDPEPLFEWAKSDDETLARVALQALGSIESPQVRAFALEMIEEVQYASPAIKMLSTNYKPGDEERVIVALEMPTTPNFYHHTGMDARDFEEAHPSPLSEKILTLLYSDTPCSLCRERTVNRLLDLNALPIWIREEAIYDASEDTRKLVSGTEGEK